MGNMISIIIIVLLGILVLVFFKSPREISRNILGGIGRFFLRAIPFANTAVDSILEEKELKREREKIQKITSDLNQTAHLKLSPLSYEVFILIEGSFEPRNLLEDIYTHFYMTKMDSTIELRHSHFNNFHIVLVTKLGEGRILMNTIIALSAEYGQDNVYCYFHGESGFFFQLDPLNPSQFLGLTSSNMGIYHSLDTFSSENDFFLYCPPMLFGSKKSVPFFKSLVEQSIKQ